MDLQQPKTHASLFSGIDGFSLAAESMGWKTLLFCEIDKFCQSHIKRRFGAIDYQHGIDLLQKTILYENITTTDFTPYYGKIDVLSGGFPCQPHSVAGLRKGENDSRHLWPEMCRAIREISPRYVVAENVSGILSSENGLVFNQVFVDLENAGYSIQAYNLPAAGCGAWHQRQRIWFIAILGDTEHNGRTAAESRGGAEKVNGERRTQKPQATGQFAETSGQLPLFSNATQ